MSHYSFSSRDSKLSLHLSINAVLVHLRALIGIVQDVCEIELVIAIHVHVEAKHG